MELNQLIKDWRRYTEDLKYAVKKFNKTGKAQKTPAYKKRRTEEALELWNKIVKLGQEIDKLMTTPDQCYEDGKVESKKIYKDYSEALAKLSDAPVTATGSNEVMMFVQKQGIRFEALNRTIEDVQDKMDAGENVTIAFCRTKLKTINDYWNRIQIDDENIEIDRTVLPAEYQDTLAEFEKLIEKVELYLHGQMEGSDNHGKRDGVKVERVTLPKFHGDYFKWVSFRDLFTSIVRNNKTLSHAERMQVLKTNLGGEAEALIADLTISDANFECAWDRLANRYDNNRVVVYKHLNKLMAQQLSKTDSRSMKKLLDTTDQVLLALKNLGRPTESWDDWIIMVITQKFSEECRKDWEKKIGTTTNLPTWQELKLFMEEEFRMLEGVENVHKKYDGKPREKPKQEVVKSYQTSVDQTSAEKENCAACNEEHKLFSCNIFKGMSPQQRWDLAKQKKLCFSCLRTHEGKMKCDRKKPCKKCKRKHSTWLHEDTSEVTTAHLKITDNSPTKPQEVASAHGAISETQVLLATVIVQTKDVYGRAVMLRALVDSGSQGSLITDRAVALLQMKGTRVNKHVSGLGGNTSEMVRMVKLNINPRFESSISMDIECYMLKKLTKNLPDHDICTKAWSHIKGLILGDPRFHKVGPIDLLLGTDVVAEIIQDGVIKGEAGQPMAQKTTFGWIVSGNVEVSHPKNEMRCLLSVQQEMEIDLSKFWELEDMNPKRTLTKDEKLCEEFYQKTHRRDSKGIFTVRIPFKEGFEPHQLGASRNQCVARFCQLEKKLSNSTELRTEYVRVMEEYIKLGHMVAVNGGLQNHQRYYIPHHAVVKPDSLTTKTRVVFDASARTSTGLSLNECMYTGAKLQKDLFEILMKWRKHKIVFKADIEKMYRQIRLDEADQKYHTVIWREDPATPIKEYQLTTVTFGTAAAPFMAIRTLNQIGMDIETQFPLAAEVIRDDFYVDDLISGCSNTQEAIATKNEVIQALETGGLILRKWTSNSQELLDSLPPEMTEKSLQMFSEEDTTKALGLQWNPRTDKFSFTVKWTVSSEKVTKRQLLSEASRLFDPLGWLAPVIIIAKMMMQEVWTAKVTWDEEVPPQVEEKWRQFRAELTQVEKITIDRWICFEPEGEISLHGFCDASEKAYAAVVYTRMNLNGSVSIKMIASKTRVAPIKTKITLPRLELCGSVLLGHLLTSVKESLNVKQGPVFAWSDSMIALGWIKGEPIRWKTFVANRVADVQSQDITHWKYVKSEDNPADCASRGLMPSELKEHPLWWTGPTWLKEDPSKWPSTPIADHDLEQRTITVNLVRMEQNDTMQGVSSWTKLVRLAAYGQRWKERKIGNLTAEELNKARTTLYRKCQEETFSREVRDLTNKRAISRNSELLTLNPVLDEDGVLRVGGRLANAKISDARKHPIILPAKHQVTRLIIRQMHQDTLHGGPQLMRGLLQKRFWIIQCKRLVNNECSRCVVCRRYNGQAMKQMMGDLPESRVTLERAFLHTGVDYAGPVEVKSSTLRNAKMLKGYIALFVCMGTKAVHLEIVSDMTTEAFLAAFNRFMARRGLVSTMYSDNGSNFLGGANQLEKNWLHAKNVEISGRIANRGIGWKFIPPATPNFGGIWERGIRSTKDHLKRTLKTAKLTFEEYGTVLCQIEACLNSRPLCALTKGTDNLNALTPGHFLIGDALLAPPQPSLLDNNVNRVNRWKHLQLLQQHFWNRWNTEYLTQLQQRHKWNETAQNIQTGDVVLVKDEQLPPRNWLMGKVMDTNPGKDGKVRVVLIKTAAGKMTRPIRKLCPLITQDEWQDPPKPPSRSKCLRSSLMATTSMMLMFLILLLVMEGGMARSVSQPVTLEPFTNMAGIYFEDLGRGNLVKSEWHMILRFNLGTYLYGMKMLQDGVGNLKELCTQLSKSQVDNHCHEVLYELTERLIEMKRLNKLIRENKSTSRKVKRAAPLNLVGWATHELFGIMAADQADHIEEQINLVTKNEDHLLNLIKNQTTITEATMDLFKSTQEDINQNFGKLDTALAAITNESTLTRKGEHLLGWILHVSLMIEKYEKMQQRLLDMLTDLQQGHVNSYILTPQKLKEQLTIITNHLPVGSKIPEGPQHDMRSLYALIRGKIRVTEKNLLVDISIPLVTTTDYQIFHVIAIPTEYGGSRISIIPDSKYLLITLKRDSFYAMSEREYEHCMKPKTSAAICKIEHPVHNLKSDQNRCERELLAQVSGFSSHCRYELSAEKDVWIQLHQNNRWIYGLRKKNTLNVICQNQVFTQTIQGSGVMEIQPGCEVTQQGMTIMTETQEASEGRIDFHPNLNLSNIASTSGSNLNLINMTVDQSQQLSQLHEQLEHLKEESHLRTVHHAAHYGISLTMISIILGIMAVGWFNRKTFVKWYTTAIATGVNIIETNIRERTQLTLESSDANQENSVDGNQSIGKSSTEERHRRGECPFRT